MKKMIIVCLVIVSLLGLTACKAGLSDERTTSQSDKPSLEQKEASPEEKVLVAYFSCTGTTRTAARYAAEILGADLYEIIPEEPYTEADLAYYTDGRADQEQNDPDARPAISGSVEDMGQYDAVLIGYPIWHGQAPRIISTFLESYDFEGKTMIPFCTSHSSGIGSSDSELHPLCPNGEWREGESFYADVSKPDVESWLDSLHIMMR